MSNFLDIVDKPRVSRADLERRLADSDEALITALSALRDLLTAFARELSGSFSTPKQQAALRHAKAIAASSVPSEPPESLPARPERLARGTEPFALERSHGHDRASGEPADFADEEATA